MDTFGTAILSFIERLSSLRRLKSTSKIEKGPQSVSFIERFIFLLCPSIVSFIERCCDLYLESPLLEVLLYCM